MKKLILFLMFCVCLTLHSDNVLLWMFNDPDIIELDGSIIKTRDLVGRGVAEGKQVNAVRIATVESDGTTVYLDLFDSQFGFEYGNYITIPMEWDDGQKDYLAGPAYASLSGLNLDDTSRTFLMEIGYATFDGDDLTQWIVMASASETYQNLREHWNAIDELSYQGTDHWSPIMSVPEPDSSILIVIGACFLILRRKLTI